MLSMSTFGEKRNEPLRILHVLPHKLVSQHVGQDSDKGGKIISLQPFLIEYPEANIQKSEKKSPKKPYYSDFLGEFRKQITIFRHVFHTILCIRMHGNTSRGCGEAPGKSREDFRSTFIFVNQCSKARGEKFRGS